MGRRCRARFRHRYPRGGAATSVRTVLPGHKREWAHRWDRNWTCNRSPGGGAACRSHRRGERGRPGQYFHCQTSTWHRSRTFNRRRAAPAKGGIVRAAYPVRSAGAWARLGAGYSVTPQILVVDDDLNVRQAIRWILEDEGYLVSEAADGHEALRLVRESRPDLVVLDLTMPEVDGYAVAAALQTGEGTRVPILLITADGQAPAKADRINAFAYLRKPFAVDELLSTIRQQLQAG